MSEDLARLEEQVNALLGPLAAGLDRVPPANVAVLERVKAAVRQEINEQWLAAQASPAPSRQLLDRIRAAVRCETRRRPLTTQFGGSHPRRWQAQRQLLAGLAAAAMVLICVGLIRHVGNLGRSGTSEEVALVSVSQQPVDLFAEAAEVALVSDEGANARSLSGSRTDSQADGDLDELNSAMQDIMGNSEPKDNPLGQSGGTQGVLG